MGSDPKVIHLCSNSVLKGEGESPDEPLVRETGSAGARQGAFSTSPSRLS